MKYGIFKRYAEINNGVLAISFTSLQNPTDPQQHMTIEADDDESAASKARTLMEMLNVKTHSIDGCTDTIMGEFPNYFVGRFATDLADRYDTSRLLYQIHTFVPVPKA